MFASPLSCGGAPTPVQHDAVWGVPSESIESVVFLEFVAGAGPFAVVECITGLTIGNIQNKLFIGGHNKAMATYFVADSSSIRPNIVSFLCCLLFVIKLENCLIIAS